MAKEKASDRAIRAVERLVGEQRARLDDMQRNHAMLEQALIDIRAATPQQQLPERDSSGRQRTPPPSRSDRERDRTPPPMPLSKKEAEGSRMVQSHTDPSLSMEGRIEKEERPKKTYKNFRDDPRYHETGKQYGEWPPYPAWQDMPIRKFVTSVQDGHKGKRGDPCKMTNSSVRLETDNYFEIDAGLMELQQFYDKGKSMKSHDCGNSHFGKGEFVPMQDVFVHKPTGKRRLKTHCATDHVARAMTMHGGSSAHPLGKTELHSCSTSSQGSRLGPADLQAARSARRLESEAGSGRSSRGSRARSAR